MDGIYDVIGWIKSNPIGDLIAPAIFGAILIWAGKLLFQSLLKFRLGFRNAILVNRVYHIEDFVTLSRRHVFYGDLIQRLIEILFFTFLFITTMFKSSTPNISSFHDLMVSTTRLLSMIFVYLATYNGYQLASILKNTDRYIAKTRLKIRKASKNNQDVSVLEKLLDAVLMPYEPPRPRAVDLVRTMANSEKDGSTYSQQTAGQTEGQKQGQSGSPASRNPL